MSLVKAACCHADALYGPGVPKLWQESIEAHRSSVRDAALDATAALVMEHGLAAVTMSRIAQDTGVGRATLYKYFADVDALLEAWHQRHVQKHVASLAKASERAGPPVDRLHTVLTTYAEASRRHRGHELASLLHQGEHVVRAQEHLRQLVADLIATGAAAGELRDDVAPKELATYCLHALTAASALPSDAAVRRLVEVTIAGLRP